MFLLGRKTPALLGIDISSTSIKVLELAKVGNRYRVESYGVEPLPPNSVVERHITDVQLIGEAIGRAVKKSGTRVKLAACAVSGSSVITKIIPMDKSYSDEEMESQIELEADQYIPFPLEEISLDFEVQGPSETDVNKVDVLLAASRNDNIEVRVAALTLGGVTAKIVDVEAFALENAVKHMLSEDRTLQQAETIAVVDIGATTTSLNVMRGGKVIYTREQPFGGRQLTEEIQRRYGLSYEEAGLAKRKGGLPENYEVEILDPFKDTMALEVNRALQFFYSSSQISTIDRVILAGGCASIAGISEIMHARTGADITVANPFANMSIAPRIREEALTMDAPAMMIAFGLALRSFD